MDEACLACAAPHEEVFAHGGDATYDEEKEIRCLFSQPIDWLEDVLGPYKVYILRLIGVWGAGLRAWGLWLRV